MGKEKPAPRRLQLTREDMRKLQGKVLFIFNFIECKINFTPARFNLGSKGETTIVTSSGPYIITWDFNAVKEMKLYKYQVQFHYYRC